MIDKSMVDAASQLGVIPVLLMFVLVTVFSGLFMLIRFAAHRILDPKDGLAYRIIHKHEAFVDHLQQIIDKQSDLIKDIASNQSQLLDRVSQIEKSHASLVSAIELTLKIAGKNNA